MHGRVALLVLKNCHFLVTYSLDLCLRQSESTLGWL